MERRVQKLGASSVSVPPLKVAHLDHIIVEIPLEEEPLSPPRGRMSPPTTPLLSADNRRTSTVPDVRHWSKLSNKWVHAIPFVIFFCFFVLWWFSYPVNLAIRDGRIVDVNTTEKHVLLTDPYFDLGRLTIRSAVQLRLTVNDNADDARPASNKN